MHEHHDRDPFEPHHHPASGGVGFTPEDRAALGQVIHAQAVHASLLANLTVAFAGFFTQYQQDNLAMTVLQDAAAVATAEANRAAAIVADLTAKNATLTTDNIALTEQVAALQATQVDPAADQAAADPLIAATAALKSADDVAQPPPPSEPAPTAEVDPNAPPVEPDPNATV